MKAAESLCLHATDLLYFVSCHRQAFKAVVRMPFQFMKELVLILTLTHDEGDTKRTDWLGRRLLTSRGRLEAGSAGRTSSMPHAAA